MNNDTIEMFAIDAVKDSIAMSDFLSPYLREKDKEPSWDGYIYIYKTADTKNENLEGRLSVQVKGKNRDDQDKEEISFPLPIAHLNNYLYDGGVVFFVVYISSDFQRKKIYYNTLTPIKLRSILKKAQKHNLKTKSIKLREFPKDINKKASILLQCLNDCKMQASFFNTDLLSIDELIQKDLLEEITVPVSSIGIEDPISALMTNEIYMYAKIKGTDVFQPLEMLPRCVQTKSTIYTKIGIMDKVFYDSIGVINEDGKKTLVLGDSFTFTMADSNLSWHMRYTNSKKLRMLSKDLEFFILLIENGYIEFDGKKFEFNCDDFNLQNVDISKEKKRLKFIKNAVAVLDMLKCEDDLDIDTLNKQDWSVLDALITAFIYKKPVSNLKKGLLHILKVSISNLSFVLCFFPCEGADDTYKIFDFFKTELNTSYKSNGIHYPLSQYYILQWNDLRDISNIDFDKLLPSFQKQPLNNDSFSIVNLFFLNLLRAYDTSENGNRKQKIIDTSTKFAKWLLSEDFNNVPHNIRLINYLQVIKRTRALDISEERQLYAITEDNNSDEMTRIGAYLLLGQQSAAEIHYDKLNCSQKEEFKTYPIYTYWGNSDKSKK